MKRKSNLKTLEIYERLVGISRDLASTLDLNVLLRRIVQVAVELCDAEASSILLFDGKKQELIFQASTDIKNEERMHGIRVPKESIAGWVATHRQSLNVPDVHQDGRFFSQVETKLEFPTQSLIATPMIVKDKLIGVLEVLNKHAGSFTSDDLVYLTVLSDQAAVAIENARLFHQSDLISELVHELRTPLTSIMTICFLLEKPEISDADRGKLVSTIHTETNRLNEMATEFLDLARLESGRTGTRISLFSMGLLVKECCQMFQGQAAENGIDLHLDLPGGFLDLEGDRDQIKQLILNLLSNAIKYNRPNGKVIVCGGRNEREWQFSVTDSGLGIPEDSIPNLFTKFYRVRGTENYAIGTGLGLSICKQIVHGHGGRIEVKSKVGEGTTFTVLIPNK